MDQYVINIKTVVLFWDMVELHELISKHGSDSLKDYLDSIEYEILEASPDFKFSNND